MIYADSTKYLSYICVLVEQSDLYVNKLHATRVPILNGRLTIFIYISPDLQIEIEEKDVIPNQNSIDI